MTTLDACHEEMSIAKSRTQSHQSRNTKRLRMPKGRQITVYLWRCTKIRPTNPWTYRQPRRTRRYPDHHSQTPNQIANVQGLPRRNNTGTGFLIEEWPKLRFKRISDRISTTEIWLNNGHNPSVLVVYAPTLRKSEQNPTIKEEFYAQLNSLTSEHKNNKHLLLLIGDFNA